MGWSYTHKGRFQTVKQFMAGIHTWESDDYSCEMIDSAYTVVKREFYAAVKQVNKKTGEQEVFLSVMLIHIVPNSEYDLGYKSVSEVDGSNCPERILKLLTDVDDERIMEHRKKLREKQAARKALPKISMGKTYKLENPIGFSNGVDLSDFVVTSIRGSSARLNEVYKVSISRLKDHGAQLVELSRIEPADLGDIHPEGVYSSAAFDRWKEITSAVISWDFFDDKDDCKSFSFGLFEHHPVLEIRSKCSSYPGDQLSILSFKTRQFCPGYSFGVKSVKDSSGLVTLSYHGILYHKGIQHKDGKKSPPYFEKIQWVVGTGVNVRLVNKPVRVPASNRMCSQIGLFQ